MRFAPARFEHVLEHERRKETKMIPTNTATRERASPHTQMSKESRRGGNDSRTPRTWKVTTAGIVMGVLGAAIFISWSIYFAQGFLADGLLTIKNNSYVIFLLAIEMVMGITALLASWGLLRSRPWGRKVAFIAVGLMLYSTVNTLGGSLKEEDWFLTSIMLGGLAGTLLCTVLLWRENTC